METNDTIGATEIQQTIQQTKTQNGANMKPVSITFLRGIVKNCNAALASTFDCNTRGKLIKQRETAYTAIKLMQAVYASGDVQQIAEAIKLCSAAGIPVTRKSIKPASDCDTERIANQAIVYGIGRMKRELNRNYEPKYSTVRVPHPSDNRGMDSPAFNRKYATRIETQFVRDAKGELRKKTALVEKHCPIPINVTAADLTQLEARARAQYNAARAQLETETDIKRIRALKAIRTKARKQLEWVIAVRPFYVAAAERGMPSDKLTFDGFPLAAIAHSGETFSAATHAKHIKAQAQRKRTSAAQAKRLYGAARAASMSLPHER